MGRKYYFDKEVKLPDATECRSWKNLHRWSLQHIVQAHICILQKLHDQAGATNSVDAVCAVITKPKRRKQHQRDV